MTTQISDSIRYNGKRYNLYSNPFDSYIDNNELDISFHRMSTANLKGYLSEWTIKDNLLFLTEISGSDDRLSIEFLFKTNKKVLADWYSGELIIPFGDRNISLDSVFLYEYEHEMKLIVKEGKVMNMEVIWDKVIDNM